MQTRLEPVDAQMALAVNDQIDAKHGTEKHSSMAHDEAHANQNMTAGKTAYFEGQYVPIADANVNIMTHAFNYGTALFEGIRGYYAPDEDDILIFRLEEHIDRLVRNFNILCMDIEESPETLSEICVKLVRESGFKEGVYIRPIAYKSGLTLAPLVHNTPAKFCCYVIKLGDYVNTGGLSVMISSWRRLADNAIPSRAKTAGGYVNSALAASEAHQAGFDEAIVLREDGAIAEGSAMNLFLIQDGVLHTPPPSADILVGITRNTVIHLAREELGLTVVERPIARTEVYVCDELFFCGTGAQIAPVTSVDRRPIQSGKTGPITQKMQDLYFDVVTGKVDKYRHWCTPVK